MQVKIFVQNNISGKQGYNQHIRFCTCCDQTIVNKAYAELIKKINQNTIVGIGYLGLYTVSL